MTPSRVQWRARTRGWRKPEGVVLGGRPSRSGNPFVIGRDGDRAAVVEKHRAWLLDPQRTTGPTIAEIKSSLRGRDLACWCALDQLCHADVLLEIANGEADP
ncbi:MAG: DUF4326 domain-containing protein [Alphaproteobacteria bacterium]|nr:DUF4326 domain-containing protein [Alphaproteobacteria bacterium]